MKQIHQWIIVISLLLLSACSTTYVDTSTQPAKRWTEQKANQWYSNIKWPVGANFVPSTAVNQLEMWQEDTFDPMTIDKELAWAASIGMNTMRVFLHNLAWQQDPSGFLDRVDQYLAIAEKHNIATMFVFFDSVWDPEPSVGVQRPARPHVHNSGWLQSPGKSILLNENKQMALAPYVKSVLTRYKNDKRVLLWDLYNEPDNDNRNTYGGASLTPDIADNKSRYALSLMKKAMAWAREVDPSQPITIGVWGNPNWINNPTALERYSLQESDVISFHSYGKKPFTERIIRHLQSYNRPLFCTEYMARPTGSTFEAILPLFKQHKIAAYNWGLVAGKTQTQYPWNSWQRQYKTEPKVWFHDIFRANGTPYRQQEVDLIKALTQQIP
ncbi:1,4-beta-xylanase [Saccharobesus litoralis]|uniref:1,4-beta-xylanase n=1 Tax=Saccharobesus litoralis TaxID=2172099 RepID=A0A2S0VQ55_9ALTE|nr:cellulase family glycosylhydrolase [Saccharobesus litoralis]AWB66312.1 1,4-beta-xylanase [Saccharobesus litoralis]